MLMRYHWGLGIGHAYAHTATSTNSLHSSFPCSEPPDSSKHGIDEYIFDVDDEINEGGAADELEFGLESESGSESHSDSESVLGDRVDMYGWGSDLLESGYYGF